MINYFKCIILIIFINKTYAQSPEQNLIKYWYYKNKLLTEFITSVSDQPGGSLPASIKNQKYIWVGSDFEAEVKWGDGTIDLAYYIAALVLEYKLLNVNGQSTYNTEKELYYAIEAINRLDLNADSYFSTPQQNWLNGFIIRSDIGYLQSQDDVKDELNSHNPLMKVNAVKSEAIYGANNLLAIRDRLSQWQNGTYPGSIFQLMHEIHQQETEYGGNAESQDQIIHLLVGLAFAIKLLPPNLQFVEHQSNGDFVKYFEDGEPKFVIEAKNIFNRLVNYIHTDGFYWSWVIKMPGTDNDVTRGASAFRLSKGIADAQFQITGQSNNGSSNVWSNHRAQVARNDWNYITNNPMPNALGWTPDVVSSEANKWLSLMAIGDCCGSEWIAKYCVDDEYDYSFLALVSKALKSDYLSTFRNKNGNDVDVNSTYLNLLNSAPCFGPYNYSYSTGSPFSFNFIGYPIYPEYEWSSTSRIIHSERRGDLSPDFPGHYNGLDYIFLFNLYSYIYGLSGSSFSYTQGINVKDLPDYPFLNEYHNPNGIGSYSNPETINSLNTIEANNNINQDGDVTYRAADYIDLQPGFSVNANANFNAFIDPFDCVNNSTFQRIATVQNGNTIHDYVNNKNKLVDCELHPNPFIDELCISIKNANGSIDNIDIFNIYGEKVRSFNLQKSIANNQKFIIRNLSDLKPGIYLCTVKSNIGVETFKIIKTL